MNIKYLSLLLPLWVVLCFWQAAYGENLSNPIIRISTNFGDIEAELFAEQAPITVTNFINHVNLGYYNGTLFHRIIKNFIIQAGGYAQNYHPKPSQPPIKNESKHSFSNQSGTLAMARTADPHSASTQFFINLQNNTFLDFELQQYGIANTIRDAQLAIKDHLSGQIITHDCHGNPIEKDTLQLAQDSDEVRTCLMQSIDPGYTSPSDLSSNCLSETDFSNPACRQTDDTLVEHNRQSLELVRVRWGYTVFGKVTAGMDVVNRIQLLPTGAVEGFIGQDAPIKPVIIQSITRITP